MNQRLVAEEGASILDDDGEIVPAGTPGALHVRRSRSTLDEYNKNPAATERLATGDWLSVGDVAYQDEDSPTLTSRAREMREELERSLAAALADDAQLGPDDPRARLLATSVIAAFGIVHAAAQRRLRAGEHSDAVYPDLVPVLGALFDQIEHGTAAPEQDVEKATCRGPHCGIS